MQVSAKEWMASENMLADPVYTHARSLKKKFSPLLWTGGLNKGKGLNGIVCIALPRGSG